MCAVGKGWCLMAYGWKFSLILCASAHEMNATQETLELFELEETVPGCSIYTSVHDRNNLSQGKAAPGWQGAWGVSPEL